MAGHVCMEEMNVLVGTLKGPMHDDAKVGFPASRERRWVYSIFITYRDQATHISKASRAPCVQFN